MTSLTNGSAPITTTNTYNERLQPITLSAAITASTILSLSYDFHRANGDNGNVVQVVNNVDNNRTKNYTYDALNRIASGYTQGNSPLARSWGETFTIDAWGNLTNRAAISGKTSYEPLSAAALSSNRLSGFGYDAAGNMISNGGASYTYDAENRLTATAGVTYTYDGDGNRVKKSNGTLYWGSGPLAESDLTATATSWKEYVFFNGKRVARRDALNSSVHYYFADHLGSTSIITNSAGTTPLEEDLDYYPYGGVAGSTASDHYMFTGKERDAESGLDNFEARYLGSSLGRFMSPDPGEDSGFDHMDDPQAWNGYAYVRNNPLNATDPDGRNYRVCDFGGKNCADLNQDQYNQYLQSIQGTNTTVTPSGQIQYTNDNGSVTNMGTATYYNEKDVQAAQMLAQTGATLSDPRTIGAFYGGSALLGLGFYAAGAYEGGLTVLELGGEASEGVTPTAGQVAQVQRQLAEQGKKSLEKSLRSFEKRLAKHEKDLAQYKEAGGHTSYVEGEIRNFKGLINAIKDVLSKQ